MSRLSIQAQITILGGVLAVLLVSAVVAGASFLAAQREVVVASESMTRLAGRVAHALDAGMFERFREIKLMAGSEPLRDLWTAKRDQGRSLLEAMQSSMPEYAWIGFAASDGTVQVATDHLLEGRNVEERPWFREALERPFVGDLHEAQLLASLLRSENDEPLRFVLSPHPSVIVGARQRACSGLI